MINKKIMLSGISIVASLSLMAGATFAFFTSQANSTGNVFNAGTLSVDVVDQNADTAFANETLDSNWAPGDQTLVNFDVRNTGNLPVHLSGAAGGTWGNPTLDVLNKVRVVRVERWNGASWETLMFNASGITGDFYYTNDGATTGTPFVVNPGERAQLQLTVEFDPTADDQFQGATFTSQIQVNAKQTNAPW